MSDKQIVERLCALVDKADEVTLRRVDRNVFVTAYEDGGDTLATGGGGTLREALEYALDAADAL